MISRLRMFRIQMSTKALSQHRARRQRRRLGARLPADDALGGQRARRRLRPGHRRARLGRRAQPDLLDRPARVDPAAAASTRCTSRPRSPASGSCSSSRCSSLGLHARPGPRRARSCAGSARKLHFDPDTAADRPAPGRRPAGGADRRPRAAAAGVAAGRRLNWLLDAASLWVFLRGVRRHARHRRACWSRSGWPTSLAVIPITPGGLGIVEGIYIPTLVGFGLPAARGDARRRLVPHRPVLVPDPPRRPVVRLAARRAVVDRAPRPARPSARHRPPGDGGERAAHRVRPAAVGAQAPGEPPPDDDGRSPGRARRGRHGRARGARPRPAAPTRRCASGRTVDEHGAEVDARGPAVASAHGVPRPRRP